MKKQKVKITVELDVELASEGQSLFELQEMFEDLEILVNTLQNNDHTVTVKTLEL